MADLYSQLVNTSIGKVVSKQIGLPQHVHSLTARAFGFRSAIAHGMWTSARCMAALASRLPGAYVVEVAFRRPLLLPASVQLAERPEGGGELRFGVRDARDATRHLDGVLTPA